MVLEISIKEIEKALGLDNVKPIQLTSSDANDMQDKKDDFKDWYEYELRQFFTSK